MGPELIARRGVDGVPRMQMTRQKQVNPATGNGAHRRRCPADEVPIAKLKWQSKWMVGHDDWCIEPLSERGDADGAGGDILPHRIAATWIESYLGVAP